MAEDTAISWTHSTFNPWSGCAKVSAGCANCYAANLPPGMRRGAVWGASTDRVPAGEKYLDQPLRWNESAKKRGVPWRVFCGSTMDVFEERDGLGDLRARLWGLIEETPHLTWLLVTKRAHAIMGTIPDRWRTGLPPNVWVLVSVEDQWAADHRIEHLARVPAVVRGLSMEPMISRIDLSAHAGNYNWLITGGESGTKARPMEAEWVRAVHRQAREAGAAVHHKQMGSAWAVRNGATHPKGGDPAEWPEDLRVREFPEATP